MTNVCDCELSHNGMGLVGRECDQPDDIVRTLQDFCEMGLEGGDADPLIEVMHSVAAKAAAEIERLRKTLGSVQRSAFDAGYDAHRNGHERVAEYRRWSNT